MSTLSQWIIIQGLFSFALSQENYLCQESCKCNLTDLPTTALVCNKILSKSATSHKPKVQKQVGDTLDENCNDFLYLNSKYYGAASVHILCRDVPLQDFNFRPFFNLTRLSIVQTNLDNLPSSLHTISERSKSFNFSDNSIANLHFSSSYQHSSLETLDLSGNVISNIEFSPKTLPKLRYLFIQRNKIVNFSSIKNLISLEVFDASFNPVSLEQSKLSEAFQLKKVVLHSVPSVRQSNTLNCRVNTNCAFFPANLEVLDLSSNQLCTIPHCSSLLFGLQNLQVLLLEHNQISFILESSFLGECFNRLRVISFHNNTIIRLDSNFLGLPNLRSLVLSNNYLQHIPLAVVQRFSRSNSGKLFSHLTHHENGIILTGNKWSCDCFQQELRDWLLDQQESVSINCSIPERLVGQQLKNLNETDLKCSNATILLPSNATKVAEYSDGALTCYSSGIPKPMVHWITPQGEILSRKSLAAKSSEDQDYKLSTFGEILIVKDVRLSKTGIFRCVADNQISSTNATVALSVVLSNLSTIIYLVIACVAFIIGIILNSVNMCMYTYEHIQAKRRYKKAIQEQEKEERLNPPIQQRSRAPVDDSMASLNADRHYGKYDFTCQQMFLDTVIKGAHSVKKTLYDARHSEFSTNMWGYAASIKDRLHIELPSSMPSISMPSISMPTISMPSMPTIQDINTNIEKLGSSMMTRSHNLATSVGSVFTLKRWIWQQQDANSSDENISKEGSEESLEKSDVQRSVNVDVHRADVDEHGDEIPSTSKQDDRREGFRLAFSRLLSNRSDSDINAPSTSKSLPDYTRRRVARNLLLLRKTPPKTVSFLQEDITIDPESPQIEHHQPIATANPVILTISEEIDKSCHSYETSV